MTVSRSRVGWIAKLLLLSGSLAITLVVFELGLRLFWGGYYLKAARAYAQPDALLGWANRPNIRMQYGEPEFVTTVEHNEWGFRGPAVAKQKPGDRYRILVLGDSFAYGVGVEGDETFSARLEQLDPRLEVINTGVNGYGTSQELLLLREKGLAFRPDLIIVSYFWNDVANSYTRPVAHFELREDELRYPTPAVSSPQTNRVPSRRRPWLRHSYLYRFASDRTKTLRFHAKLALRIPIEDGELLRPEQQDAAWQLEFALLREIDRLAREADAAMLLVVIPEQVQVQPDVRVTGLVATDYEIQERLERLCDTAGIPMLDLLPALRASYARDGEPLYYHRDRHLRANGHALSASLIYEKIRSLGFIP